MRFNRKTLLGTALLLALAPVASATTLYVNGVSGSDSNNCLSATTACKTIGHAIFLTVSGDSIVVAPATYTENLTIGKNLTIVGSGASTTIIDGGGAGTVVTIINSSAVTLSKLTIRHGFALFGAGIDRILEAGPLSIISSIITGNSARSCGSFGGGIANYGTLTITNSTIRGNSAVSRCIGGTAHGGGIYNNAGALTINRSTVTGNSVSSVGCRPARTGCTGGFAVGGGISANVALKIADSTISENATSAYCFFPRSSRCTAVGGGIETGGTMAIASSTLARNSATCGGKYCRAFGGGVGIFGTATIQNSIIANSSNGNCEGLIRSNGYNLSSDSTCNFSGPGDLNNTNPKLGTLGSYGGPTQTIPLLSGSPAIDAGDPTGCFDSLGHLLKTDQRGMARPDKEDVSGCDMGAYEHQSD